MATTNKILLVVFLSLLVDLICFTFILPLFPRILNSYSLVHQKEEDFLFSQTTSLLQNVKEFLTHSFPQSSKVGNDRLDNIIFGGLLGSLFSFIQFIFSPMIGSMIDRYGRKPILILSMLGTMLGYIIWGYSRTFTVFFISRVICGIFKANVQISSTIVSDLTLPNSRSSAMALIGIAFSLGFTIGPLLGALISQYPFSTSTIDSSSSSSSSLFGLHQYSSPAFFSSFCTLLNSISLLIFLPETKDFLHPENQTEPTSETKKNYKSTTTTTTSTPSSTPSPSSLFTLHFTHLSFLLLFSGIEFSLTFLTFDRFSFSNSQQGILLSFVGLLSIVFHSLFLRKSKSSTTSSTSTSTSTTTDHSKKPIFLTWTGIISLIISSLLLSISYSSSLLYFSSIFLSYTSSSVVSSLLSLCSLWCEKDEIEKERRGRTMGVFRSSGQLGRAIGPVLVCGLYWSVGPEVCYWITSVLLLIPLFSFVITTQLLFSSTPSISDRSKQE